MADTWPELVRLDRLPSVKDSPSAGSDVWEERRHNPEHPIFGIVGPYPRHFKPEKAEPLLEASVAWLVKQVRREINI